MVDRNSGDLLPVPPAWSVEERKKNTGVTTKPTLSVSMDQSSNLEAIANDQQISNPASAGESMPLSISISQHISNQSFTDGATLDKQLSESEKRKHEAEMAQNGKQNYKHKKEINLPRRSSKRLAGIKLDPVPELKRGNRARRVAVEKAAVEREVTTNVNESLNSLPNGTAKQFDAVVVGGSDTRRKLDSATNTMESGQSELHKKAVVEHDRGLDAKLDYSLDLPLGELLTDPCIAFAIQTLTGVTFESCENYQISSELKSTKHTETSDAAERCDKEIKLQNIGDEKEGCNAISTPENLAISKEHATYADIGVSWMDPCIEFAIKTLTGNGSIPSEIAPNSENYLQQQLSSSSNTISLGKY